MCAGAARRVRRLASVARVRAFSPQGQLADLREAQKTVGMLTVLAATCEKATSELQAFGDLEDATFEALLRSCPEACGVATPALSGQIKKFLEVLFVAIVGSVEVRGKSLCRLLQLASVAPSLAFIVDSLTLRGVDITMQAIAAASLEMDTALQLADVAQNAMKEDQTMKDEVVSKFCVCVGLVQTQLEDQRFQSLKSEWFTNGVKHLTSVRDMLKEYLVKRQMELVLADKESLTPIAGGGVAGDLWSDGYDGKTSKHIVDWAKQYLIDGADGNAIKRLSDSLGKNQKQLTMLLETFGDSTKDAKIADIYDSIAKVLKRASCTLAEASFVSTVLKNTGNILKTKRAAINFQSKLTQLELEGMVHLGLVEAGKEAERSRLQLR